MKKKGLMKRSLSLLLALTLVLGSTVTVFADGEDIAGMNEAQEAVETAHTAEVPEVPATPDTPATPAVPASGSVDDAGEAVTDADTKVGDAGITLKITEVTSEGTEKKDLRDVKDNLDTAEGNLGDTSANLAGAEKNADEASKELDKVQPAADVVDTQEGITTGAAATAGNDQTTAEGGQAIAEGATNSTDAKVGVDQAEGALTEANAQVAAAQDAVTEIETQITTIEEAIKEAEEKQKLAQEALDTATGDVEKAETELKEAEETVKKLQAELDTKTKELKSSGYALIQTLKDELLKECAKPEYDPNSGEGVYLGKTKPSDYWKRLDEISKAYIRYEILANDNTIPDDATVEIDDTYTHPSELIVDEDGKPILKDGKKQYKTLEDQNYVKVIIKLADGTTKTRLYNYKMDEKNSKTDIDIVVTDKVTLEVEDKTQVVKEEGFIKTETDPVTQQQIEKKLTEEALKASPVVFENKDAEEKVVSKTIVGEEITAPILGQVTEDKVLGDLNKGEKVEGTEKVEYTLGTAKVLTGYDKKDEKVYDKDLGKITQQDINRLKEKYAGEQYTVKAQYFTFLGGWQDLKEGQTVEWYTVLAGCIGLGVRVKVYETVDDTTKPKYEDKECVIKITTGNVDYVEKDAQNLSKSTRGYAAIAGGENKAKNEANTIANNLKAQGYTNVKIGEPEYILLIGYFCKVTYTIPAINATKENVTLATEYFDPDTYNFSAAQYGTKTVYKDGDELVDEKDEAIQQKLTAAKEELDKYEAANVSIQDAVEKVEKAKKDVDDAKKKVDELNLNGTKAEIAAAETELAEAKDKVTNAKTNLEDTRDAAAKTDEAYRAALAAYNRLLAAEAVTPGTPAGPAAPGTPATPATVPAAAGVDMATLMALLSAGATGATGGVAGGAVAADDEGIDIPDAGVPLSDGEEVQDAADETTEDTEIEGKDIANNTTPLAAPVEQSTNNWWWLLLLAAVVVTGSTIAYNENKKRQAAKAEMKDKK